MWRTVIVGLDPNRYRSANAAESEARYFSSMDSLMSDSERFMDCDPLLVRCRACKGQVAFAPICERDVRVFCPLLRRPADDGSI